MDRINLKLGTIKEPLPKFIIEKLSNAFNNVNNYPQNYDTLIERLAEHHKTNKDKILLCNGTDGSIDLITKTLAKKVYYYEPTYYEFWSAPKRNNVEYQALKSQQKEKYILKTRKFGKDTVLFLCNPNNPFGKISLDQILEFADKSKGYVAIDEAYIEFSKGSPLKNLDNYTNLILMRSFSKTYAMAGIRTGYIIAAPSLIKKLGKHKVFFDVSSPSVEAVLVALEHHKYFKEHTERIIKRKKNFVDFLIKKGFNVIPTHTNNAIIHFGSESKARKFVNYLKNNNIIINQGNGISTTGLDKSWVRLACGTKEQMEKVTEIIDKYK